VRSFSARILKLGINPCVVVPDAIVAALRRTGGRVRGPLPVRGTLQGAAFQQTLVQYAGAPRLYLNRPMLDAAQLAVGDLARVRLEFDPVPRRTPVPPKFARALRGTPGAEAAFAALRPSHRKDILRYLGALKTAEAFERNVAKVLGHLVGRHLKKPGVVLARVAERRPR